MLRSLFFAAALALAAPAMAQAPDAAPASPPATLSVSGTGEVSVPPDMATLMIGVESRADTAAAAVSDNNQAAQRIIQTLKDAGIEGKDIQTANFSVSPVYDQESYQRPDGPRVIGYQATNQVVARIRDLDGLGGVLDAAVGSGANRIDGLVFGIEHDEEARDQARRRAIEDARRKAELYAEAAGVRLARIQSIREGGSSGPIPMYDMRAAAAPETMSVPIERGQTTLQADVQLIWEIEPAQ